MVVEAGGNEQVAVPSTSQSDIMDFVPRKMTLAQKKKIDGLLMDMFKKDFQPFSLVDDVGFRAFVQALNPAYEMPSRKTVANVMLEAAYTAAKENVEQKLQGVKSVCLTTDCWTSAANDSYMAVTGHFIREDLRLQSVLLECAHFSGQHTTANLSTALVKIMDPFSLHRKVIMIVTDNAANIKNAVSILNLQHFGCYAHTLNLIVQDALKNFQEVHQKVKTIVGFFKRSSGATEQILKYQKNSGSVMPKKLKQDMPTRWNSTLFMLERLVVLKDAVKITVALLNTNMQVLSEEECIICSELCSILKLFEQVSRQLSAEGYPTGSSVIVITDGLMSVSDELAKRQMNPVSKKVVEALRRGLSDRFQNIERKPIIALTTLLDPRYKLLAFENSTAADSIKKLLIDLVAQKNAKSTPSTVETPEEPVEPNSETESLSVFGKFIKKVKLAQLQGTAQSSAIAEVRRYVDDPVISINEDPLAWWRKNNYKYPTVVKIVKEKFHVVATSVPCERIFSKTGTIINDRRTRLTPSKVEKLIFLNANGTAE